LLATVTGTSDNNNITDSSSNDHTITVNGDAHAGTFSPYRSGGYSTYFDGNGDYLEVPQSSNSSSFGTGEFTVEFWFKPSEAGSTVFFIDFRGSANSGFQIFRRSTNFIRVRGLNQTTLIDGTTSISDFNTWYHICVHRNSSNELKLFINGAQDGGTVTGHTTDYAHPTSGNWLIGKQYNSTSYPNGYMRDVRIVKGTAITPTSGGPTERLEAVTNTTLLTCHLPYISDGSTNDHSITVNGNVSTKPFSPHDYDEYSATDHGGSVFLGGTAHDSEDRLEITIDTSLTMGSGDFTYEAWVYLYSEDVTKEASLFSARSSGYESFILKVRNHGTEGTNLLIANSAGSSWSVVNSKGGAVFANVWTHVAIVRNGTSIKVYTNGKEAQSHTFSGSLNEDNNTLYIGYDADSRYGLGHVSDVRITKGTAVYTTEFIPPTAPLSSAGSVLHIKGTDASIIDKSQGSNLKLIGNTTGSTTQVKFSNTKSMYFDGSGDYVEGPTISDLNIGTGDFTVECWLYETTTNTNKGVWDGRSTGSATDGFTFTRIGTDTFRVWSGSALITTGSFTIQNTWNHCALVRNSGTLTIYINGTSSGTPVSNSTNFSNSGTFIIGGGRHSTGSNPNAFITGYIQDLRVSNYARYTANFTPPTASLEG
jgi:hypothetical protein